MQIFNARKDLLAARKRVLNQRIEQLSEQINGYEAEVESALRQLDLIAQEIKAKVTLQKKGILPLPVLQALQRLQAEISGRRGQYVAEVARTKLQIGETQLQLLSLDAERADEIATDLDKTRVELATTNERLSANRDIVAREVVAAPVNGTVVSLKFKTEGGVIQHGEPILDIVPSDEQLLINARVLPTDIDVVHVGLPAVIHLTAFTSRNLPRIEGKVQYVSADRLVDEKSGQPIISLAWRWIAANLIGLALNINLYLECRRRSLLSRANGPCSNIYSGRFSIPFGAASAKFEPNTHPLCSAFSLSQPAHRHPQHMGQSRTTVNWVQVLLIRSWPQRRIELSAVDQGSRH